MRIAGVAAREMDGTCIKRTLIIFPPGVAPQMTERVSQRHCHGHKWPTWEKKFHNGLRLFRKSPSGISESRLVPLSYPKCSCRRPAAAVQPRRDATPIRARPGYPNTGQMWEQLETKENFNGISTTYTIVMVERAGFEPAYACTGRFTVCCL